MRSIYIWRVIESQQIIFIVWSFHCLLFLKLSQSAGCTVYAILPNNVIWSMNSLVNSAKYVWVQGPRFDCHWISRPTKFFSLRTISRQAILLRVGAERATMTRRKIFLIKSVLLTNHSLLLPLCCVNTEEKCYNNWCVYKLRGIQNDKEEKFKFLKNKNTQKCALNKDVCIDWVWLSLIGVNIWFSFIFFIQKHLISEALELAAFLQNR